MGPGVSGNFPLCDRIFGGVVVSYLSYFMAGDVIHSLPLKREARYKLIPLVLVVFSIALAFVVRYRGFSYYLFKYISFNIDCGWLSGKTFYIYMFHTLFIVIIGKIFHRFLPHNELEAIAVVLLMVFVLALFSAVLYDCLWKVAEKRWKSKEKWYAFFNRVCDRYLY